MLSYTLQNLAMAEFEQASNTATDLAERIAHCDRSRVSTAEMVVLLEAWRAAREQARASHERMLAKARVSSGTSRRLAVG